MIAQAGRSPSHSQSILSLIGESLADMGYWSAVLMGNLARRFGLVASVLEKALRRE
ncbi:hypothetical protein [Nostoc sp.]